MKSQISNLKSQIQILNLKTKTIKSFKFFVARHVVRICGLFVVVLSFAFLVLRSADLAIGINMRSDTYRIDMGNLNMSAGNPSSSNYKLGITMGQTAPGKYESTGYIVRAGFQYIHSIIPFSFSISDISLDFGALTPNVLTNEQSLTLRVSSGSAGGYQVTVQENNPLTSKAETIIPDTACDPADPCTHIDSGTWTLTSTYGFGYTMTGTDVPSEFSGGKYKNFGDYPDEAPQKVMGKTPAEGHQAARTKIATMSARINISSTQAAGEYQNILTFVATPTF